MYLKGSVLLLLAAVAAQAAPIVFSATGTAADITSTVNDFRVALGILNPPGACTPSPCTTGRREVNWDAVPAGSPRNPFAGDFFNNDGTIPGRTRGLILEPPPGNTFGVFTASPAGAGIPAFSPDLIFGTNTNVGTTFNISFAVPGQPANAATTSGFGIVFIDVESANLTQMRFFDAGGNLQHSSFATVSGNELFSFLGVQFTTERIARVEVTAGGGVLLDGVLMDDFLYGEPVSQVPEPSTVGLLGAGLIALAVRIRRDSTGSRRAS